MAAVCEYRWSGRWGVDDDGETQGERPDGPVVVAHVCVAVEGHLGRHRCHCGLRSRSGVAAPLVDPERGVICWWQPIREYAAQWPAECPQCGHSTLAHVGVEKCPVCVLIYHGTEQWRRMQARLHGLHWPR